jgi:pentapeptide repeat protein
MAMAAVVVGTWQWASARRAASGPANASSVVGDQTSDGPALSPRTTAPATSAAGLTTAGRSRRQWNWSAITSAITAFTALAALVFTGLSLSTTEQGQFTDRYTTAMDQLGTLGEDHLQTRLGAVYALERLAHDSPRDQPTIVQVLSTFVRANLPQATPEAILLPFASPAPLPCPPVAVPPRSLSLDVQAALTVLGRRDNTSDDGAVTDLHNTCLTSVDLSHVNLAGADLDGVNLMGSDLTDTRLDGARHDQHTRTKGAVTTGATGVWW